MPRPACCTTKHGTQRRMRICKRSRTPTDSTAVLSSPPGSSDGGERRAHAPSQAPGRPAQPLDTVTLADDAADVERTVQRRQMQAVLRRSLADVASNHPTVLVLRNIQERDPAEVARTLGVTRRALNIRAHRARKALRSHLVQAGVGRDGSPPLRVVS